MSRSPIRFRCVTIPTISQPRWYSALGAIAGRMLTEEESDRAERLCQRGLLLRNVADQLFGSALVDAYFLPKASH